ncbi:hypothetical protein IWQ60_009185 [Tieghemiomyces parasiticus]|uniref:Uncharacterized protein n=1 Tax=Tieghemiomyces parasiticus TaxID=78921 RepID=A0A9W8DPS8_9FUNG|nr:hypothetical protein IWQ60_009185 [Tieghemiomyces parasiticus]
MKSPLVTTRLLLTTAFALTLAVQVMGAPMPEDSIDPANTPAEGTITNGASTLLAGVLTPVIVLKNGAAVISDGIKVQVDRFKSGVKSATETITEPFDKASEEAKTVSQQTVQNATQAANEIKANAQKQVEDAANATGTKLIKAGQKIAGQE